MRRAPLVLAVVLAGGCSLSNVPDLSSGRGAVDSGAEASATSDAGPGIVADGGGAGYRAAVTGAGPIAYYRFEEASGTVAHDERGAFDATYGTGVTLGGDGFVDGSRAARIGTTGPGITGPLAGLDFAARAPFSFEAWVSPHAFPNGHGMVFFKGDGSGPGFQEIGAYVTAPDKLVFERYVDGQEVTVSASLPVDRFTHVVCTYDGSTLRLFRDGALVGSLADGRSQPAKGPPITFGFDPAGAGQSFFDGSLDELAIYDRALSEGEVARHAATRAP